MWLRYVMANRVSVGKKHKLKEPEQEYWVYTQTLSDGRIFVQAISYDDGISPICCCRNPSLEVLTADHKYWCSETSRDIYAAVMKDQEGYKMMGMDPIGEQDIFELLHSLPEEMLKLPIGEQQDIQGDQEES